MQIQIESVNESLVDEYILKVRKGFHLFDAFLIPMVPARKDNKVILDSRVYTARGILYPGSTEGNLVLQVKISQMVKIAFGFIYLFLLMFLIYDDATIDGIEDPTFLERLGFVLIGFLAFSYPLFLLHLGRKSFVEKLKKDFYMIRNNSSK